MPIVIMDTKNQTFHEIIGNGYQYKVPRFQRDYSWGEEQWEDLWVDIESTSEEGQHYMGYVVLQSSGNKQYSIIDGQQRLSTISIIILAALKHLKDLVENGIEEQDNKIRSEEIRRTYIGSIDAVSLTTYNKLELNRNNNESFRKIAAFQKPPIRGVKRTNKLMNDAFQFFYKKTDGYSGLQLAKFIDGMANNLLFTKITVNDELNAYKVFETLNSRGVQLSTPDLLKNYLFSTINKNSDISETELDDLDVKWDSILEQLGKHSFSDFLQVEWNTYHDKVTKNELFKKIRNEITTRELAYKYVDKIYNIVQIYVPILSPDDEFWSTYNNGLYKNASGYLSALRLFNIKQHYGVALVAFEKFEASEFVKLLKYIVMASIRYNAICGNPPNEQERTYNILSRKITKGEYTRASHIKNSPEFRKIYPSNEEFVGAFEYKHIKQIKKIKYLLSEIEIMLGNESVDFYQATIEHVLPATLDGEWRGYFGDDCEDSIDRLGNMTLLTRDENKLSGRQLFEVKKSVYQDSKFSITKKISEYDEWDRSQLNTHQEWLAIQASKTWCIDYDDSQS